MEALFQCLPGVCRARGITASTARLMAAPSFITARRSRASQCAVGRGRSVRLSVRATPIMAGIAAAIRTAGSPLPPIGDRPSEDGEGSAGAALIELQRDGRSQTEWTYVPKHEIQFLVTDGAVLDGRRLARIGWFAVQGAKTRHDDMTIHPPNRHYRRGRRQRYQCACPAAAPFHAAYGGLAAPRGGARDES